MGGRGSASASSRSFSTGDKSLDAIAYDALKRYKDVEINSKLQKKMAERHLERTNGDPEGAFEFKMKLLASNYDRDLKDIANFERDIARREADIKRERAIMNSYSKERRTTTSVRGDKIETNSKRYEKQAHHVMLLNKSLDQQHKEQSRRKASVKAFKENFYKKADEEAKRAQMAKNYKKKR